MPALSRASSENWERQHTPTLRSWHARSGSWYEGNQAADAGRPAFEIRVLLAATLAASYGIYSGFELCENVAIRSDSEEYLDSEKYEIKVRD